MNIFPRLTCRWSRAGTLALALLLPSVSGSQVPKSDGPRDLPPFLEDFNARKEPPIATKEITFPSAVGSVRGFWARQDVKDPLPGVLLVYDEESWTIWMRENASHLAGIGYGVLAVNLHQRRLAASRIDVNASAFVNEPA